MPKKKRKSLSESSDAAKCKRLACGSESPEESGKNSNSKEFVRMLIKYLAS